MRRCRCLVLASALALCHAGSLQVQPGDTRQAWLQATVQASNPVREQLAMLSQPGQPLSIRVYRGADLRAVTGQPQLAHVHGQELTLSEGLLDQLGQLADNNQPTAARWTLLYVLAYLGARHPELQAGQTGPPQQQQALAMLSAVNQVLATAWEEAGRPQQPARREQLLLQVLDEVAYARQLQAALDLPGRPGLRRDADGFVLDQANARLLAERLGRRSTHAGLEHSGLEPAWLMPPR